MDVRRRTFLKTAALVAAGTALPGCKPEVHKLVPYLLPDDEIVPGLALWYASTCDECAAGCGVLVRTMEGRAKKIEGNPEHPVNEGKLCARGQAAVQGLYHPDRLQGPLRRDRRTGDVLPVSWNDVVTELATQLRGAHGRVVMISRPVSGAASLLLQRFMEIVGGRLYWYDPAAEVPLRTAVQWLFGMNEVPQYDLAEADYLLSFGTPFLEQWLSPVTYGVAYGRMRQARPTVRGRFVHVEPRFSLTAANADQWIPIRPGTEGLLALGLGHVLLAETPGRPANAHGTPYRRLFESISLTTIAQHTEVQEDLIVRLARELAAATHPLVMGGGSVSCHTNSTRALVAINSLNGLLGNIGKRGGVRFFERETADSPRAASWLTERTMEELLAQFRSAKASVLLVNGCNPVFGMPPAVPIVETFGAASFVASFGQFFDETSSHADLICADHHWLEAWGDGVPHIGLPVRTISLRQPVVRSLYGTRQTEDVLLDVARMLRPEHIPWDSFHNLLQTQWGTRIDSMPDGSEEVWMRRLQSGGSWSSSARTLSPTDTSAIVAPDLPSFVGDERQFPFLLYPYPSMTVGYGGAHLPWLQELPDTLTTAMWGTWVEINPATAARLGVKQGDIVRLESQAGTLEAPALLYPGLRPEMLAMPIGQGHTAGTRYERGRGVNPLRLVTGAFDRDSGALAAGATRVRLERTERKGRLVLLQQPAVDPEQLIRIDSRAIPS
ncbi:MAG TPA: molybdopterin-dependent oxidoreductase [Nitrospira sp.]|nr:molybdopterin-dependent oxidoreductase [Nitrospira sp.]